jgi:hypothetical protein
LTISRAVIDTFRKSGLQSSFRLEVVFDNLPISEQQLRDAIWLVDPLLTNEFVPSEQTRGEVRIARKEIPAGVFLPGDVRVVRIRYMFAVMAAERRRLLRTLREKFSKEADAWASAYPGIPIFAAEESDGAQDMLRDEAASLLNGSPFIGMLTTHFPYGFMERIHQEFRAHDRGPVDIEQRTFRENFATWCGDDVVLTLVPDHAIEDHDLFRTVSGGPAGEPGSAFYVVRSLSSIAYSCRVGELKSISNSAISPEFEAIVQSTLERMRGELNRWPRAPDRATPYCRMLR